MEHDNDTVSSRMKERNREMVGKAQEGQGLNRRLGHWRWDGRGLTTDT